MHDLCRSRRNFHRPDAFVHNFYKSNAEKMGEWKTASHIERQSKAKKSATTPTAAKFKTGAATKPSPAGQTTEGLAGA